MRPHHILLFLLLVAVFVLGAAAVWPKEGLQITREYNMPFITLEAILEKDTTTRVNVDSLLAAYELEFDSTAIKDSLRMAEIKFRKKMMRIQYADSTVLLENFFKALNARKKGVGKVRILHYGDSQIEGDRITSVIRNGFQKEFGGTGPGYIAASPLTSSLSLNNAHSDNWSRYPVFGNQDSTLSHNHFGMYGVFSRFTPFPVMDTVYQDTIRTTIGERDTAFVPDPIIRQLLPSDSIVKAWVELSPSKIGYFTSRKYNELTMLFRNPDAPFKLIVTLGDSTMRVQEFPMNSSTQQYRHKFVKSPSWIRLDFESRSSPDIYGIRMESDYGVVMDNIPMRGSSGTFFGKINYTEMADQFASTKPDLIILQFGGNPLPYIEDQARVDRYGRWFASQIRHLRRMNPNSDFVVVGPSDMSIKDGTNYVTYPFLPAVRDVLKKAAFENGCGYWDMFEVMGGRNSMPGWVGADPPLAAPDYVHFTRSGTIKIAELFYDALIKDYEDYVARK